MEHRALSEVAAWAGLQLAADTADRLLGLADWLVGEGSAAGGIGPREGEHVWERHILDSLMFARGWAELPPEIVDVGTGIGLPGLPLAIAAPGSRFVLLDRSGRRIRLIRRAIRRFGIENVDPVQAELEHYVRGGPMVAAVMRGVLRPGQLPAFVTGAVAPGGTLVVGAGIDPVPVADSTLERFPGSEVLEPGRWLRIMRRP